MIKFTATFIKLKREIINLKKLLQNHFSVRQGKKTFKCWGLTDVKIFHISYKSIYNNIYVYRIVKKYIKINLYIFST